MLLLRKIELLICKGSVSLEHKLLKLLLLIDDIPLR